MEKTKDSALDVLSLAVSRKPLLTQVGTGLLRVGVIDMKIAFKVLSVRMSRKMHRLSLMCWCSVITYYVSFWRAGLLQVVSLL